MAVVMKTIFIVSTHSLFREAIEQLIKAPSFTIVGKDMRLGDVLVEASTATPPDLVICILDPDQDTSAELEDLKDLHGQFSHMKTMILMPSEQRVALRAAVQSGVDAILTTKVSGAVLRNVIELVFLGQRILPPEVVSLLDDGPTSLPDALPAHAVLPLTLPSPPLSQGRIPVLSMREKDILRGLMNGCSNKVIARELTITEATVKVHMKALLRKIQMTNRTQAAIWAINNGFATRSHQPLSDGVAVVGKSEIVLRTPQPGRDFKAA